MGMFEEGGGPEEFGKLVKLDAGNNESFTSFTPKHFGKILSPKDISSNLSSSHI